MLAGFTFVCAEIIGKMRVSEVLFMYKNKLCLGLLESLDLSFEEQIRLMKKTGFEAFFIGWNRELDMESVMAAAREEGMILQSIHAPYIKMADMWKETENTQNAIDELIACLADCQKYGAPIMVVHAFIGFENHEPTEFGLKSFEKVVCAAKEMGIKVAFENTEGEEYLAALMEYFEKDENVGFCWDTGHEMCYNYSKDMLALYGDRLLCTHLNDNLGIRDYEGKITWIDDLHLLPFDGAADWADIAARLNRHGYDGILTFELTTKSKPGRHENDVYGRMDPEEYITNAYIRACRVAMLKQRING